MIHAVCPVGVGGLIAVPTSKPLLPGGSGEYARRAVGKEHAGVDGWVAGGFEGAGGFDAIAGDVVGALVCEHYDLYDQLGPTGEALENLVPFYRKHLG